jgi:uncharacterized protein (TIGR02246 family)
MRESIEKQVRDLYRQILSAWNEGEPGGYAASFTQDGSIVGFDGSQVNGREDIERHLQQIFTDHQTAAYIGIVREVRFLSDDVALLRAVAGMVPPGQTDINPAANAIQSLMAVREAGGTWHAVLFQNTPAQFHGRPEAVAQLNEELRAALAGSDGLE